MPSPVVLLTFVMWIGASVALGVAMAYGLYRWTKRRWVWALTPAFVLLWLSCGSLPYFGAIGAVRARTLNLPTPSPPPPAVAADPEPAPVAPTGPAEQP